MSTEIEEEQVKAGRYEKASEALREGLRLLEQQAQTNEQNLKVLRELAAEGFRELAQGQGLTMTSESGLRNTIARIGRRAAKTTRQNQAE